MSQVKVGRRHSASTVHATASASRKASAQVALVFGTHKVSRFVHATCRYFLFRLGPGPARSGVSSPQMTRAKMTSANAPCTGHWASDLFTIFGCGWTSFRPVSGGQ
jgi:hypothetical protein